MRAIGGRPDVVVVGAGAAGLACAAALAATGRSILVLEAADRVGGRVHSHRCVDGTVLELGAQVVHDRANAVWDGFDLGPDPEPFAAGEFQVSLEGRRRPLGLLARRDLPPWGVVPALAATAGGTQTVAEWLAGPGRSAGQVGREWVSQEWAADPTLLSVPELLAVASTPGFTGGEVRVRAGFDRIPAGLATGLDIRLRSPVRDLWLDPGQVVLRTDHGVVRAASAVIAVPPWTIGPRGLKPVGLPADKRRAAFALRGGDAVVAILRVGVDLAVDPAGRTVFAADSGWGFVRARSGGREIHVVAKGPGAARLRRSLADPRVLAPALDALFGVPVGPVEVVAVADWGQNPFTAGAFTTPTAGWESAARSWSRPWDDRVAFAGETTAGVRGVGRVHGALISGLRAADEILASSQKHRSATSLIPVP